MDKPVLIIGAGIVGLTLGHALRNKNIPFQIFERDELFDSRPQGWAITLHWGLEFLQEILPRNVLRALDTALVDPDISPANDNGKFLFLNLADCSTKFNIPPSRRMRLNRQKMRQVLMADLMPYIHWGKIFVEFDQLELGHGGQTSSITAIFADESRWDGRLIVGADGNLSTVRRKVLPNSYENQQLPIRFLGTAVSLTREQVQPLRDLDPLLFQGCHPDTNTFFWFSIISTPASNTAKQGEGEDDRFVVQMNVSWPVRSSSDQCESTSAGRLAQMRARAAVFDPRLRAAISHISEDADITEVKLADWECPEWDNRGGQVTLAGDAAHTMTMFRGEAANYGILDAFHLANYLGSETGQNEAVDAYEKGMRQRSQPAVLLSRQACMDAHDWACLNEDSALLRKRTISQT